jgi:hypothetical protein
MTRILSAALLLVAVAFSLPAAAIDYVLDFSGNICNVTGGGCSNFYSILDSYGDVPGIVDVQYDRQVGASIPDRRLSWWDANYSELRGVAWGGNGDAAGTAEIFLDPAPGQQVTLSGFQLGAYPNIDRLTYIRILDGSGDVLAEGGSLGSAASKITISGASSSTFDFALTSDEGIRIQWGPSAYNTGIDNIRFSVTPIPEPGTWALMGAGLALLGFSARRRRAG